jgi:serine O-acetyltransferase
LSLKIRSSLQADGLAALATRQLDILFQDDQYIDPSDIAVAVPGALARLEYCFEHVGDKYFFNGLEVIFDHLHGDQYAMWLYLLSNELFLRGAPPTLCKKLFLLNRALNGCDLFYEIAMPSIFLLVHPLGTVLGRGNYSDFLVVYQQVAVGSNKDIYPSLGKHITLHPGSSVLGRSIVGDYCSIAAGSLLLDGELPEKSVYIGNPRDYLIRPKSERASIWRI